MSETSFPVSKMRPQRRNIGARRAFVERHTHMILIDLPQIVSSSAGALVDRAPRRPHARVNVSK